MNAVSCVPGTWKGVSGQLLLDRPLGSVSGPEGPGGQLPRPWYAKSWRRPVVRATGSHYQLLREKGLDPNGSKLTRGHSVEGRQVRRAPAGRETSWPGN